ncbi:serine hydrolase [Paenibacillus sp. IB182496]|uniref:Serine hydrolase n=2 Tax=Paenibacillus sabuli TaxID=2772509 RepID=A0A927GQ06_9BACL|nr:serine hydrolase [Paenibacillus sabuli]
MAQDVPDEAPLSESTQASVAQAAPGLAEARELTAESAKAFLDEFFADPTTDPYYTGASVAIIKDGEVLAESGYGLADAEQEAAVDPQETLFRVASVSKTFTAVAIMQLVEQGLIELGGDIRDYLPELEFDNTTGMPVTVADLLLHLSGLEVRDPKPTDLHPDLDRVVEIEDVVMSRMPDVVREPGSAYMYDNFGYQMLGLIVQEVSGERFEDYVQTHIFEPLGMDSSTFVLTDQALEQLATGYDPAGNPLEPYAVTPTVMPEGGMLSTAGDMTRFMLAFLGEGELDGQRVLSEASVREMEQYRAYVHELLPDTTYGFEAPMQLPGAGSSDAIVTKAGDLIGFSSYLVLLPEEETGFFLTYNQQGVLRNLFYPAFMAAFFPEYAAPAALDDFTPQAAGELDKFTGYYADLRLRPFVTQLTPGEGDGTLTIADAFLGARQLQQVDDNLFVDELTGQFTGFRLDEMGEPTYMKEPYLNPLGYAVKGEAAAGFADVSADDPYAAFIHALQSLGYYPNDNEAMFGPEVAVSRAEYVQRLLAVSMVQPSASSELAFADLEGHPLAGYVQAAYELGMVQGSGDARFEPDRPVQRQEAAVMVWRLLQAQYPNELFADVALAGETAAWAEPAVRMMVALGLYGPEVELDGQGAADYRSRVAMNREQLAALLYRILTQPTDQIVAAQQSAQQAAPEADPGEAAPGEDAPGEAATSQDAPREAQEPATDGAPAEEQLQTPAEASPAAPASAGQGPDEQAPDAQDAA